MQLESNVQKENQNRLQEGQERAHRQMSIFSDEGWNWIFQVMCRFSVWYCIAATSNLLWVSVNKLKMARTVGHLIPPTLEESCWYLSVIES